MELKFRKLDDHSRIMVNLPAHPGNIRHARAPPGTAEARESGGTGRNPPEATEGQPLQSAPDRQTQPQIQEATLSLNHALSGLANHGLAPTVSAASGAADSSGGPRAVILIF